jgi:hypothetical protein
MRFILATLAICAGCTTKNNCPSGDCSPYATYQDCYNDHHVSQGFATQHAIEICCIDHPIGSAAMNVVCGATAATCMTYVTANLTDPNDANLATDISTACADYVVARGG